MQFRLSMLFLIFFNVAASLALCGAWGLWISAVIMLAALCLNRAKNLKSGISYAFQLFIFGIICPGILMLPAIGASHEARRRAQCIENLKLIGIALHNFHKANGHFPEATIADKNGKPMLSWRVEILPFTDPGFIYNSYTRLYDSLKKDEPWNSPHNAKVLDQVSIAEYNCPTDTHENVDVMTNYIAIIGPGTAWREDGLVKLSDLPDGGSHTVMAIEVANSGVHWAEPRDLTVDEALERMKTGKGLGISSGHPNVVNILFADGTVRDMSQNMPISAWKKLFEGKIDVDQIEAEIDESAQDFANLSFTPHEIIHTTISKPKIWPYILSFIVWLFSVALLFHRAIKSRRKPALETELIGIS
jgi:prepilin-type processing-associated H-X9-DG protein